MEENKSSQREKQNEQDSPKRPLGLSLILIFTFVYNGLLLAVMIAGLFYPDVVQNLLQQYYKSVYISQSKAYLATLAGVLVFGVSFYGLILMWQMRRSGFYFYAAAQSAMLITLVFVLRSYDYINIALALVVILIFALHTGKMK